MRCLRSKCPSHCHYCCQASREIHCRQAEVRNTSRTKECFHWNRKDEHKDRERKKEQDETQVQLGQQTDAEMLKSDGVTNMKKNEELMNQRTGPLECLDSMRRPPQLSRCLTTVRTGDGRVWQWCGRQNASKAKTRPAVPFVAFESHTRRAIQFRLQ